jgi:type IV pilus assembly protein PilY1
MNIRQLRKVLTIAATAAGLSVITAPAVAAEWSLADTPLFLSAGVKPNLIMAIDDSGSMDGEMLLRGNDGAAWWRRGTSGTCLVPTLNNLNFTGCTRNTTGTADIPGTGSLNFNYVGTASATWKKFIYLFPNGSGTNAQDMRRYTDATDDHYAVAPLPQFAWSRSPESNGAYFDPNVTYTPWVSTVAPNVFTAADKAATKWDPVFTGSSLATVNLANDLAGNSNPATATSCSAIASGTAVANWGFRVYTGMTIPVGTCIRVPTMKRNNTPTQPNTQVDRATPANWEEVMAPGCVVVNAAATGPATISCYTKNTVTNVANQAFQLVDNTTIWIRYFPATFYVTSVDNLPADYGLKATYIAAATPSGKAVSDTTLTDSLIKIEIKAANFVDTAHYNSAINNFANWFQFYRKRHLALRAGLGAAFNGLTGTRVAGFTINSVTGSPPNSPSPSMGDIDVTADRNALFNNFYRNWTGNGGTPNRNGVANIIRNFQRNKNSDPNAPVTHSCQRNFGMLFTDGFSNVPDPNDGITSAGNADGAAGAPYADTFSGSMADATWKAYKTPLLGTSVFPAGKVLVPTACSGASPDVKLDCNTNLHMNFYAVTLGTRGLLFDPDNEIDPYVTPQAWPTSFQARHPSAVDDIWHATINGRGQLLNAASSAELADKLSAVLRSIIERVGSASSAAVNSGSISSETRLFQASFDSKDWSGKLTGRQVNMDGTLGTEVIATIPAANSRDIFTVNSNDTPVEFVWSALDSTRRTELKASGADTLAQNRLDWIRGVRTDEAPAANNLRKRTVVLGDIINSAPAYIGSPTGRYPDNLEAEPYSEFRADNLDRTHMVYAGGNDGMLHAFSSNDSVATGAITEQFAFIPSVLVKKLHHLTSTTYTHRYYVDGTPSIGDAFIDGGWHTMLVGGLNKGGQEIYALDITDPDNFDEDNVQWEFTDADDSDLGYTFSRPTIVRAADGNWYAGFGNGYGSTEADDHTGSSGNAVLFMINLDTGALIKKIDTGVGRSQDPRTAVAADKKPNGLSTPIFIDADGDRDVDYAYAGDLFGNMWKFDLRSSNPSSWSVANGAPLFVATNADGDRQPITARPNVARGPKGSGQIVLFGTGKYLETADTTLATLDTQSFYAIWDKNTNTSTDIVSGRGVLTQQTIDTEGPQTFGSNTIEIRQISSNAPAANALGWYLDFISPGDVFRGEMQVTDPLVRLDSVIFTTLVPNTDPCEFGGSSWLMEMNLFTGRPKAKTPWDLNDNGLFDDLLSDAPIAGIRTTVGITPKPASLYQGAAGSAGGGDGQSRGCEFLIFPGTSGGTQTECRDPGPRALGRQSWRQAH